MVENLPEELRRFMFGDDYIKVFYNPFRMLLSPSRSTLRPDQASQVAPTGNNAISNLIRSQLDQGCLRYLQTCLKCPYSKVDRYHFNALIQALRVVGDGHANTCLLYTSDAADD